MRGGDQWLGLDIGGANLKAATAGGYARETPFPLWRMPDKLPDALVQLRRHAPDHAGLAVTMTGELADCYRTKAEGVAAIVDAVQQAAAGTPAFYFLTDGSFVDAAAAVARWRLAAASNWFALARALPGRLIVDVGSTTTDITPPASPGGADDAARLMAGRLVYLGVQRTPLCAVVDRLPYRGRSCPVAAELFATTGDAALVLGHRKPSDSCDTADGRPATVEHAAARIARMLCIDPGDFDLTDAAAAAEAVVASMTDRVAAALKRAFAASQGVPGSEAVLAGSGDWLAAAALKTAGHTGAATRLADAIGAGPSRCAPAWAVAKLCQERAR
ncbi:MAG: hydantoinase/oxoprolinase family protein [Planctomycetota bacterium]